MRGWHVTAKSAGLFVHRFDHDTWYDPSSTVTHGSGIVQATRKTGTGSATGTDTGVRITIGLN